MWMADKPIYPRKVDRAHNDIREVLIRRAGYPLRSVLWAAGHGISGVDLSQSVTISISGLHFKEKEFWRSSAQLQVNSDQFDCKRRLQKFIDHAENQTHKQSTLVRGVTVLTPETQ